MTMTENSWINHPELEQLDPVKRELIKKAAAQIRGKSGTSMATVMMGLITSANKQKILFTPNETALILDILKDGKTPQEKAQIDNMIKMVSSYMKKGN